MEVRHRDMVFKFDEVNKSLVSFGINGFKEKDNNLSGNLICLARAERGSYFLNACGATPRNITENTIKTNEHGFEVEHPYDENIKVNTTVEFLDGINVVRQRNTVVNHGSEKSVLEQISSTHITGIDNFGELKWNDKNKFKVHYCKSRWCGEAQWYGKSLHDLGLYMAADGNGGYTGAIQFSSKGTWTTSKQYPLIFIEDMECGVCYYLELEDVGDWTIEIGYSGAATGSKFYIEANGANYESTGWKHELNPNESYITPAVVYGCIKGDFETAVREMIKYKRKTNLSEWPEKYPYLVFNDYMNCLSAQPTDKNSIPLIDAAAEAGAEVYCIDAGWFNKIVDGKFVWVQGDWVENDELFGEYGLQGIIDYIKSKGMIPGIWTELERLHKDTFLYNNELYLKNADGTPIYGPTMAMFADVTKQETIDFFESVIDRLYEMGIRYIKNDYNASTRGGPYMEGKNPSECNRHLIDATVTFFTNIKKKYPDLMIENCGSGGMRATAAIRNICTIQGTCDEEIYYLNPPVVTGSAVLYTPEKAGNWVYPYPDYVDPAKQPQKFESKEYFEAMADGEETIFNVINGLCGTPFLSGRIDIADEYNMSLIKEGMEVFKENREAMLTSYPVYPSGILERDNDKNTSFGLISEDNKSMCLAVWRFSKEEEITEVDLSKYGQIESVELVYPSKDTVVEYSHSNNILKVELKKHLSARYFKINFN